MQRGRRARLLVHPSWRHTHVLTHAQLLTGRNTEPVPSQGGSAPPAPRGAPPVRPPTRFAAAIGIVKRNRAERTTWERQRPTLRTCLGPHSSS
eukprot:15475948-Alexandrium_andersonii.AAC.1